MSPVEDAVPHDPIDSPWTFQRLNEHGHTAIIARGGTANVELDGVKLPMRSHARVYLGDDGPQVGTATVHPDGRVEGEVKDHFVGGRLIRHVGFKAITVTHDRVVINEKELGE